jgi:hypothetical protein
MNAPTRKAPPIIWVLAGLGAVVVVFGVIGIAVISARAGARAGAEVARERASDPVVVPAQAPRAPDPPITVSVIGGDHDPANNQALKAGVEERGESCCTAAIGRSSTFQGITSIFDVRPDSTGRIRMDWVQSRGSDSDFGRCIAIAMESYTMSPGTRPFRVNVKCGKPASATP